MVLPLSLPHNKSFLPPKKDIEVQTHIILILGTQHNGTNAING